MLKVRQKFDSYLEYAEKTYQIPRHWIAAIIIFPMLIDLIALIFLRIGATKDAAKWMLDENHPVELLTFAFLIMAAVAAITCSLRVMQHHEQAWVSGFYLLFGIGLFLIAMEEISWGQQFFKFETFGTFKEVNQQGEVNLHNIGALQGNSAYFRLVFGLGGLIGVWFTSRNILSKITPSEMLLTWFLVITFFAVLGIYKNLSGDTRLYYAFSLRSLSELNEMLIGLSSYIFIRLNMRKFQYADSMKPVAGTPGLQHH